MSVCVCVCERARKIERGKNSVRMGNQTNEITKFRSRFFKYNKVLVNTACSIILILIESMDGAMLHPGYFGSLLCMCVCDATLCFRCYFLSTTL